MKRCIWTFGFMIVTGATTVMAQPPGGQPGGPGGRSGGFGGGGGSFGFRSPLMEVLDADHDGVISADEIKNATAALITLDKDKDGKLSEEEIRPIGRGPNAGGPGGPGGEGRGPGGEGRGPGGPGGEGRGPGGPGGEGRGPGGPGGEGRGPGGQVANITPDRMLTHAMEFDADKDGKLGKDELQKFIADFMQRHGNQAGGGEGRGPSGGREGGPGSGRGGSGAGGGDRPRRPDTQP